MKTYATSPTWPRHDCTPEILLSFLQDVWRVHKRSPNLQEIDDRFGFLLAPLFAAWELENRGLLHNGKPAGV